MRRKAQHSVWHGASLRKPRVHGALSLLVALGIASCCLWPACVDLTPPWEKISAEERDAPDAAVLPRPERDARAEVGNAGTDVNKVALENAEVGGKAPVPTDARDGDGPPASDGPCVPPSAPIGVVVTPGDQRIDLSWTERAGGSQYRVSRSTTGTGTFEQIGLSPTLSFIDQPLTNGVTYYYVVAAGSGSCWSDDSAVASGTPFCYPPSKPAKLTATPGDKQASLSWDPSPDATSYTIWRKDKATGEYTWIGSSPATSYIDGQLSNGTTYRYVVAASNGSCASGYSAEQTVTPGLACAQGSPTNLRAAPSGSVQVALTWTAPLPTPKSQTISRSLTGGKGFQVIGSVAGTASSYTDTDSQLLKSTEYYYQVTANGACMATSPEALATPECLAPAAPSAPSVSNSYGGLAVAWSAVKDATAYSVFRDTSATGAFQQAVSTAQKATGYTDPAASLSNGATYFYKVSASNGSGQCGSAPSKAGSVMFCAPPAVPVGLQASNDTSGQIRLTWTASPGATQYTVLRGTTSGGEVAITPPGTPPTSTSYTDTGLTAGKTYYYKVSAQNGAKNACSSATSSEIAVTVGGTSGGTSGDCPVFDPNTSGYQPPSGFGAYCFITCWDLGGTLVSSFEGRSLSINGTTVTCSPLDEYGRAACTLPPGLARDFSVYTKSGAYLFRVSAGTNQYPTNSWWGTAKACE